MVYERLPRSTKHTTINNYSREGRVTLISHSVSTTILRTCHEVYQEALPLVNKAMREWVQDGGVKIVCATTLGGLVALQELLRVLCYVCQTKVC